MKILDEIIFDSIMCLLNESKLLSDVQSGFRPSDSYKCQLLSTIYDIYKSFDCNPPLEVREIFLDISKCFVRAWHDALICEIKSLGISDTILRRI